MIRRDYGVALGFLLILILLRLWSNEGPGDGADSQSPLVSKNEEVRAERPRYPTPTPSPPDMEVVARAIEGLPNSRRASDMQLSRTLSLYVQRGQYDYAEGLEEALHSWREGDLFSASIDNYYFYTSSNIDKNILSLWAKERPHSHSAHLSVAYKNLYEVYDVLNGKTPDEATTQQRKTMDALLSEARGYLKGEGVEECPMYHLARLEIGLLEGVDREEMERILSEAEKAVPGYPSFYALVAIHRTQGWPGYQPQDHWKNTATRLPKPTDVSDAQWSQAQLAVLNMYMWLQKAHEIRPARDLEWADLSASYDQARAIFPHSEALVTTHLANAWSIKDKEKAHELLALLGKHRSWRDLELYDEYFYLPGELRAKAPKIEYPAWKASVDYFPINERMQRKYIQMGVGELLLRGAFAELEAINERLLKDAARESSGGLPIFTFWDAFKLEELNKAKDWERGYAMAKIWQETYPESQVAKICQAKLLIDKAWTARGTGYADQVSESGWKVFRESYQEAIGIYEDVLRHPNYEVIKTSLAACLLASGEDVEKGFALLDEVLKEDPLQQEAISTYSNFLLPRWYGEPGDIGKLAMKINELSKSNLGPGLVVIQVITRSQAGFYDTEIPWSETRPSILALCRKYPSNEIKTRCLLAAFHARDRDFAKKLFNEIGNDWTRGMFSREDFDRMKAWANGNATD